MQSATTSTCTNAGLSLGTVTVPDNSKWEDSAIGYKPTVTGPASIVSGEPTGS